ncbi:copper amine oxidase N-terminal domain-containing protein [Proteiniborus sp. MB09-C3]|uniref:copper amine oxidase N-terminal domain-containing protein n=1 Tax=Proteiniborus sp. MB09-C3 TaxID=3050072 RepID=UPI0025574576|nr:copper amine oxidase N-terminal domain-containing protein [Proteiniborus sp. MB09-C3]WIV12242.1 copper amine oxidase N-terminal domain-containing protein [Proteiniborus sp. MB09-C3]
MKSTSRKRMAVITTALILSLFLTSIAFADNGFKDLKAWFGDIKIFSNNQQVQLEVKPFIIDGTTYVPLRALSNIFNKNINWDGTNLRIDITDKPDPNIAYLSQQIMQKQTKINELETKVAQLEAELATTKKGSKYTLGELEDYLNKEYGKYEKVAFDIELYGDKDDIEVEIYVDLDDYYSKWNALSDTKIEKFIQYIIDDVKKEFKNADITGYIEDSSNDKKLVKFYLSTKGKLVTELKNSKYVTDLSDLEDYLNRNYDEYGGVYFKITLYGDEDDIEVYVTATNRNYLDDLYTYEIEDYLEDLYSEISYEFPDAYIDGYIEDNYTKYYFKFDSRGNITLR